MAVDIGWQGIVVVVVVAISLVVMAFDAVGPDLVFGGMAAIFMAARIITTAQGTAGFANSGVLTVVTLYMVAEGISQTGGLDIAMNAVLGRAKSVFWAQTRMMIPVMVASAFLNNTPIVALMIPIIMAWSRRCGIPAKKLLIPLSFATVLGGTTTIIGTSTNLVVSGLQADKYAKTNPELVFGFFDITPYGVPYAAWGAAYILLFSKWLLPDDTESGDNDLMCGLSVPAASAVVGKTVKESGLIANNLSAVARNGRIISPVPIDFVVQPNDTIYISGSIRTVEHIANDNGLVLISDETEGGHPVHVRSLKDVEEGFEGSATEEPTSLIQVNLTKSSDLVGKSVKEVGFRGRFNAAVIAVKRSKAVQQGRIGDIVLKPNDVLVLSIGAAFDSRTNDFVSNFHKLIYLEETLARDFTTAMRVADDAKIVGKSIHDAGLRGINGLYLYEIDRADGTRLKAVKPETTVEAGDTLWFAGDLEGVSFLKNIAGLQQTQQHQVQKLGTDIINRRLVQAVVSGHGPLNGKTLKEIAFRNSFGAAVIAVHRSGHPVLQDISTLKLRPGDVLVLETGPDFQANFKSNKAFSLISEVPNSSPRKASKMWIALALVVAMIATQIIGGAMSDEYIHLFPAAVLVTGFMLATKCLSADQARRSIDWEVYVCIAFAFAVSSAMEKTNVAKGIAQVFTSLSEKIGGDTAALSCMYLATAILSEILTNNAAAAIMYPIASTVADNLGIGPNLMSVAVMLGGSAGWVLPYSYQCNLMVYAAGNYRTADFLKIGLPFHFWLLAGVILILGNQDRWWIAVIATCAFFALVVIVPVIYEYALNDAQREKVDNFFAKLSFKKKKRAAKAIDYTDFKALPVN